MRIEYPKSSIGEMKSALGLVPVTMYSFGNNWAVSVGPLINFWPGGVSCFPTIGLNAKLSTVFQNSSWKWPQCSKSEYSSLTALGARFGYLLKLWPALLGWLIDIFYSKSMGWYSNEKTFSTMAGHIPRVSTICWLIFLNRFTTKDRIMWWNSQLSSQVCFLWKCSRI